MRTPVPAFFIISHLSESKADLGIKLSHYHKYRTQCASLKNWKQYWLHPLLFIPSSKKVLNQFRSAHHYLLSVQGVQGTTKLTEIKICIFSLFWKSKSAGEIHLCKRKNFLRNQNVHPGKNRTLKNPF